ncbi:hypothetical protein BDC45DRAFT_562639 [Circinella umbellata]|nr:hypothetical protein BDC45DRAFT_562639 [Circinella umbellata]
MDQKHDHNTNQHHDNPRNYDQQPSRYYNKYYSIYNAAHRSQNLQNRQPSVKRAHNSYEQTSSYYDDYSLHSSYSNSNYEQQQQQQQSGPSFYYNDYVNTPFYSPEQKNMNSPAASNTITTTSPSALPIDIGTLMLLNENENNVPIIDDNKSNSDNSNSKDKGYEYEYEDEEMEDDSDSVSSYDTAPSEHSDSDENEEDEENENSATLLLDSNTKKNEWKKREYFMNLIEEHGEEPGVKEMEGALEHHEIKLPIPANVFLNKPGSDNRRKNNITRWAVDATKWVAEIIHNFSKVDIRIVPRDGKYIMEITGTLGQCYYSIKAMDAILLDYIRLRTYYVLLRIDGPYFRQQAKSIKSVLSEVVPHEQYISELEDLHVTVARVSLTTDEETSCLINTIKEAGEELKEALQEDHFIGRFDKLYDINDRFIGVASSRENRDSIGVIRKVLQDKLQAAKLFQSVYEVGEKMHMTLYLARNKNAQYRGRTLLIKQKLKDALTAQGIELDYGPTVVTGIDVTRRAISLSAPFRHVTDFSIDL